ncbi:trehalase-like domain-containing protein [Pseudarthrobacter sp. NamE2]|uniref:trehalase-like domain-containing protein n=1 Tax=Pseudarthrobacter sp. NamE2 TaxID=2576838 RepID=UPI001F108166|nr:trehalase-like domain-containing protein [Pseudarthrobacter sp. NamE2]
MVRVLTGAGAARITFAPRPDYANAPFRMEVRGHEVHVVGTSDPIILTATNVTFSVSTDGRRATATADVNLHNGPVVLNLRCGDTDHRPADPPWRERPACRGCLQFPRVGANARHSGGETVIGAAVCVGAAVARLRTDRRGIGRAHDFPAWGRGYPQLGLPVLLVA